MQNPLEKIYDSEMDRKEFLAHVGAGVLAIAGATTVAKALNPNRPPNSQGPSARSAHPSSDGLGGYGKGAYGR